MGVINITSQEKEGLNAIDAAQLDKLIRQAVEEESVQCLRHLPIWKCGEYVNLHFRYFERDLGEYSRSKSSQKRSRTRDQAERSGSDLSYAVWSMKDRLEKEEKEGDLFFVNDHVMPPFGYDKHIRFPVSFRWRSTAEDEWSRGSITFVYDVDIRPDYTWPPPKRKPSAAKQKRDLEERLYREWENLTKMALCSVRDYFQNGGDGSKIPETFKVRVDPQSGGLNNYSTQFWRERT